MPTIKEGNLFFGGTEYPVYPHYTDTYRPRLQYNWNEGTYNSGYLNSSYSSYHSSSLLPPPTTITTASLSNNYNRRLFDQDDWALRRAPQERSRYWREERSDYDRHDDWDSSTYLFSESERSVTSSRRSWRNQLRPHRENDNVDDRKTRPISRLSSRQNSRATTPGPRPLTSSSRNSKTTTSTAKTRSSSRQDSRKNGLYRDPSPPPKPTKKPPVPVLSVPNKTKVKRTTTDSRTSKPTASLEAMSDEERPVVIEPKSPIKKDIKPKPVDTKWAPNKKQLMECLVGQLCFGFILLVIGQIIVQLPLIGGIGHFIRMGGAIFMAFFTLYYLVANNSKPAARSYYKAHLYLKGGTMMAVSRDSSGLRGVDPTPLISNNKTRHIIFIRHGESEWNEVFNRGFNVGFLGRLAKGNLKELSMFASGDSIYVDSPLSETGIHQAKELNKHLNETNQTRTTRILNGSDSSHVAQSVIVSSNLRRAIATCLIALQTRLNRTGEKVVLLPMLQEISRNIDTIALSPAKEAPDMSIVKPVVGNNVKINEVFDLSLQNGGKGLISTGGKRLSAFAEWCFLQDKNIIIVAGHSLWFKSFFARYLPHQYDHEAKRLKIVNCGVVDFVLEQGVFKEGGKVGYRIRPDSINVIYGGFTQKPSKPIKTNPNTNKKDKTKEIISPPTSPTVPPNKSKSKSKSTNSKGCNIM
eukprot:NODE_888_length_2271_cov_48.923184_g755_i0.p1 GENE.NODE_888_length_2271_cov_48.923184_g755_i0~~NODE_888_length_2271_cov_48.923184_g755_i0.p1  ORF type:complete len:694 (+),score=137.02 NODE_888_length_2271_cov_48.923184_g755_i0:72-2153(+)